MDRNRAPRQAVPGADASANGLMATSSAHGRAEPGVGGAQTGKSRGTTAEERAAEPGPSRQNQIPKPVLSGLRAGGTAHKVQPGLGTQACPSAPRDP